MQIAAGVAPSPALEFAQSHQWLTEGENQYVTSVKPVSADTVEITIADPEGDGSEIDRIADMAASVLEPVVDGVKLLVKSPTGYVGAADYFSGDEQYYATNMPGVTGHSAEVEHDWNGDGVIEDGDEGWIFPVATQADADRLDPIVRDTINDYRVFFAVDEN